MQDKYSVIIFLFLFFILNSISLVAGQGEGSGCGSLTGVEAQICYGNQAIDSNDVGICSQAPDPSVCILGLANELEDPKPILDSLEPGLDRDLLLTAYSTSSLDPSVWPLIEDNRMHDAAVTLLPTAAYGRLKKAPIDDYCNNLRGGYEYDSDFGLPEDEFILNRNLCEMVVAATNELASGGDDCTSKLSSRLQSRYEVDDPFYEEDRVDSIKNCKEMVSYTRQMEKRMEEAETLPELMKIMDEINSRGNDDECDFSGVWDTNWGGMKLQQSGASLSGTYTWDQGKISGTTSGNRLVGWWSEAPSYSPPNDAGALEFTIADDCSTFTGNWRYGNGDTWDGTWTGATKVGDIPIPKVSLPPADTLDFEFAKPEQAAQKVPTSKQPATVDEDATEGGGIINKIKGIFSKITSLLADLF